MSPDLASTKSTGSPGRSRRWCDPASVPGQVLVIAAAGAVVQGLLWFRGDSAAHVIGGAALTLFIGVSTRRRWLRTLGVWAEVAILAVMLGVTWVAEETVTGPFDTIDVAFTMAGAFVAVSALPAWTSASRVERMRLRWVAVALAAVALALRYLSGLGRA